MLKKNDCNFLFSSSNINTLFLHCNVLNTQNRFVYSILELTYRLTNPILNKIRRFLPNLGTLDISPIILLLLIWFIEMCMKLYIAPIIF